MELHRVRDTFFAKLFHKWELWEDGEKYLTRWHIYPRLPKAERREAGKAVKSFPFRVMLHRMDGPDTDRFPHDHPWPFRSFILRGGYTDEQTIGVMEESTHELVYTAGPFRRHKWHQKLPATGVWHRIRVLHRQPTWTLVVTGRDIRRWGYLTDKGWMIAEGQDE